MIRLSRVSFSERVDSRGEIALITERRLPGLRGTSRKGWLGAPVLLGAGILLASMLSGPAGAATPASTPAATASSNIDLSSWDIQLPNNTEVGPPAKAVSTYFTQNSDGSWHFDDPGTGSNCVPTGNSVHCRTELREVDSYTKGTAGGWSTSGTNVMSATLAVNTDGWPVIGQIHADPTVSVKPLLELYYDWKGSGNVVVGIQTNCTATGQTTTVLGPDPALNTQFSYVINLSNNKLLMTFGGKTTDLTSQSGCVHDGVGGYFKAGDYGQKDTHSVVTFYNLSINHGQSPTPTPTPTPTPCGSSCPTISNLKVYDTNNASKWSVQSNLRTGNTAFGDRKDTWTTVPTALAGDAWIRTAVGSKRSTKNPLASFALSAAATVYVPVDNRIGKLPWMDSTWVDQGYYLQTNDSNKAKYEVYAKSYPAGTVNLGPNAVSGSNYLMYTVVVASG